MKKVFLVWVVASDPPLNLNPQNLIFFFAIFSNLLKQDGLCPYVTSHGTDFQLHKKSRLKDSVLFEANDATPHSIIKCAVLTLPDAFVDVRGGVDPSVSAPGLDGTSAYLPSLSIRRASDHQITCSFCKASSDKSSTALIDSSSQLNKALLSPLLVNT